MNKWTMVIAVLLMGLARIPSAHAETVVLEQSGLISGSQSFVFEMQAPGAGTLNVELKNLGWPERLSSVSFAASNATSLLKTLADAGTTSFSVSGPGAYYAHVAGVAQGALNVGLYALRVTFSAGGGPGGPPVPLPAALWLFASGLGALALPFRRRKSQPA
jgi:hypothetical protein